MKGTAIYIFPFIIFSWYSSTAAHQLMVIFPGKDTLCQLIQYEHITSVAVSGDCNTGTNAFVLLISMCWMKISWSSELKSNFISCFLHVVKLLMAWFLCEWLLESYWEWLNMHTDVNFVDIFYQAHIYFTFPLIILSGRRPSQTSQLRVFRKSGKPQPGLY